MKRLSFKFSKNLNQVLYKNCQTQALESLRQEQPLEFNDEANRLLDPKLLKTKRVNRDHPFTAWDLKLPQFYPKHEDIYSQVS